MKRLLVALFLLSVPAALRAQTCTGSPCAANPIATALRVRSAVTFSPFGSIDFGTVSGGSTASVDAFGTSTSGGVAGAVNLVANQRVTVTASFSQLTSAGMPNLVVSNPSCGRSTLSSTNATNTTGFACSTGYATPGFGTGAAGIYVWLGGDVVTTATTGAGDYVGTATVTGVYVAY